MKKSKLIIIGVAMLFSCSSCGIFKKGCGCPTFGVIKCADSKCADDELIDLQMLV